MSLFIIDIYFFEVKIAMDNTRRCFIKQTWFLLNLVQGYIVEIMSFLLSTKEQELLSLHLEEIENPATNTVFSVTLSSLSCVRKIRS